MAVDLVAGRGYGTSRTPPLPQVGGERLVCSRGYGRRVTVIAPVAASISGGGGFEYTPPWGPDVTFYSNPDGTISAEKSPVTSPEIDVFDPVATAIIEHPPPLFVAAKPLKTYGIDDEVHTVRFKGPKPRRRRRRRKRELRQSQYERDWPNVLEQQRIQAGVQIAQAHAFGEYQRTERRRMWIQVGLVVLVAGGLVWLWWRQDRS